MFYKKIVFIICIFLIAFISKIFAQPVLSDTAYTTSFDFFDTNGHPTGTILYQNKGKNPFIVFQYTDGRKFVGWMQNLRPTDVTFSLIYYPDGTMFIGDASVSGNNILKGASFGFEDSSTCAGIHYPDGTNFIGNIYKYQRRMGFQFAPDGSYMLGSFWNKNPYGYLTYKTINYSANHKILSEGYRINQESEMDYETFKKKYKKEKPGYSREDAKKLKFEETVNRSDNGYEVMNFKTLKDRQNFGFYNQIARIDYTHIRYNTGSDFGTNQFYNVGYNNYNDTSFINISGNPSGNFTSGQVGKLINISRLVKADGMQFRATDENYRYNEKKTCLVYETTTNGNSFLGAEKNNQFNGYGINKIVGVGTYYGWYDFNKRSGNGTFKNLDGSFFKGSWKNDNKNGVGRSYSVAGKILEEGIYENGTLVTAKKVDLGWYEFVDEFPEAKIEEPYYATTEVTNQVLSGATFSGSTLGGNPYGYGVKSFPTGVTVAGNWYQGSLRGVCTIQDPASQINGKLKPSITYIGSVKDNKYEGLATEIENGIQIIGTYSNGKKNGICIKWKADGSGQRGNFVDDLREGQIDDMDRKKLSAVGYKTYVHDVAEGDAMVPILTNNQIARGNYHNGKLDGVWTYFEYLDGKSTNVGTITYKDGVEISRTNK